MKYNFLILGLVMMMAACGNSGTGMKNNDQQIAAYITLPGVLSTNGIEVTAKLTAIGSDGRLKLEVKIKNNTQKKLSINPAVATIQGDTVNNTPYSFEGGETGLVPGGESSFISIYKPINNPFLMQKYNIRGDLKKAYSMDLSFIGDVSGQPLVSSKVDFEIADQEYADYLSKFGIEKDFQGYNLALNREIFTSMQKKYMLENKIYVVNDHDAHEGHDGHEEHSDEKPDSMNEISLVVSGNEVMIDNIMMKAVGYKIKDTFTVFFRIINRKPEVLTIDVKKFILKTEGKEYNPANDFLKDNPGIPNTNGVIRLDLNERIEFIFEYKFGPSPKLLEWYLAGFMNSKGIKMIYTNFVFSNVGKM
jgi:hypothetical protein